MSEKRKYMRFNVLFEAICRRGDSTEKVKVNNFSREGLGVLCQEALGQGEEVEVEFMIPGDNVPVLVEGKVAWTSPFASNSLERKSGVKLKNISNSDRSRVLEYIYHNWIIPASGDATTS